MTTVEFINARNDHQDDCLSMMEDFYAIDDYPFVHTKATRNFIEFINADHLGRLWVLTCDKEIIGYLILTFGYSFEYGGRDAFIDEFYLKAPYRGKGLGTTILTNLNKHIEGLQVRAIHLEVENTNVAGNNLYIKSGFKGKNRKLLTKVIEK